MTASDGAAEDMFGDSVAIDGDILVIGSAHKNNSTGAVYVYQRLGDSWTQTAKLTASDGAAGDELGWSVAIDGDTIVAGAESDDVGANVNQGSAYTFASTGAAARTETAKLTASDGDGTNVYGFQGDRLGTSVAIDGDTIVAGAPGASGGTAHQGSAYTFARTGAGARTETAKLTASDGAPGDELGRSVAIDGDTVVAGAVLDDFGASVEQGSAYTFASTGAAARTETAKLTASDGATDDRLGFSVAIDGDTIVAGAYGDDVGANDWQGSAYTFASTGAAARTETAKLTASDGAAYDHFGRSVAIDGDTIVAGVPNDWIGASYYQGSAYTFASTGAAARTETAKLTASGGARDDGLGFSVAIDGDTVVAAARYDDVGANSNQGSGSVFFSPADSDNDGVPDGSDGCPAGNTGWTSNGTTDRDGDGCRDAGEDTDDDNDTKVDGSDSCPAGNTGWTSNGTTDIDSDGCRDAGEDTDDDNDTVADGTDNCPSVSNLGQENIDGDAQGDACDADDDNDTVNDDSDNCPTGAAAGLDTDGDGCKDAGEDADDDNDGTTDGSDACLAGDTGWTSNGSTDNDSDGCRDAGEDTDDDNDTVTDVSDECRTLAASTASGCPAVTRSLTLSYSKSKEDFKGKLVAPQPSCASDDLVTVWKKVTGDDREIGEDQVNAQGKYAVSKPRRPGRYYATVSERVVPDLAACGPATSPTLRLR